MIQFYRVSFACGNGKYIGLQHSSQHTANFHRTFRFAGAVIVCVRRITRNDAKDAHRFSLVSIYERFHEQIITEFESFIV